MIGEYNLYLVAISYFIAVLASFTALEVAGKVMQPTGQTGKWILIGSAAMGTGIWSMHFVGMEAFSLPISVVYDIPLTVLSWVAAVGVSALALRTLSKLADRTNLLDPKIIVPAGLLMGLGISIMHYTGMFAMRMSPGIDYNLTLVAGSFLIAASASIVTLVIAVTLRDVTSFGQLAMRGGAALIMGVAITGMHYTGMAAASFAPDAICTTGFGLEAGWTVTPVAIATILILASATTFSVNDTRNIRRHQEAKKLAAEREFQLAFIDKDTALLNRGWLHRQLADNKPGLGQRISLVTIEAEKAPSAERAREIAQWLVSVFKNAQVVSLKANTYGLYYKNGCPDDAHAQVKEAMENSQFADMTRWSVGQASYPDNAANPFQLISRSRGSETIAPIKPQVQY